MFMPCLTMKVGRKAMNPYTAVFNAISTVLPSTVRISTPGANRVRSEVRAFTVAGTITAEGRPPNGATSRSISDMTASASASRPWASSQRGDSGMDRRMNHTTSAPTPTITNIQRQP